MKAGCVWAYAEFLASITDYQATGEPVIADVITFTRVIGALSGRLQERRPLHSCISYAIPTLQEAESQEGWAPSLQPEGWRIPQFSHCSRRSLQVAEWLGLSFRAQFSHFQEAFDRDRILFILDGGRIMVKGISQTSFKWITLSFFPSQWIVLFLLTEESNSHLSNSPTNILGTQKDPTATFIQLFLAM